MMRGLMREPVTMQNLKPVKRLRGWPNKNINKYQKQKALRISQLHYSYSTWCALPWAPSLVSPPLSPLACYCGRVNAQKQTLLVSKYWVNKQSAALSGNLDDFVPNNTLYFVFHGKGHTKQESCKLNDFLSTQIFLSGSIANLKKNVNPHLFSFWGPMLCCLLLYRDFRAH